MLFIDNIFAIKLAIILWPIWFILLILSSFTIWTLFELISVIIKDFNNRESFKDSLCIFWILFTLIGAIITISLFSTSILNKTYIFLPFCIFLLLFFLITLYFFPEILSSIHKTLKIDSLEESSHENMPNFMYPLPIVQLGNVPLSSKIIKALKSPPRKFLQISSIYFRPINESKTLIKRCASHQLSDSIDKAPKKWNSFDEKSRPENFSFARKVEEDKCCLCIDHECNAVIMECGHGGLCFVCAEKMKAEDSLCHICRSGISYILKLQKIREDILEVVP